MIRVGSRGEACACAERLAHVALSCGESHPAAHLFAACAKLREQIFVDEYPYYVRKREKAIAEVRARLGEEVFNRAWAEGQAMSEDEMRAYALEES